MLLPVEGSQEPKWIKSDRHKQRNLRKRICRICRGSVLLLKLVTLRGIKHFCTSSFSFPQLGAVTLTHFYILAIASSMLWGKAILSY